VIYVVDFKEKSFLGRFRFDPTERTDSVQRQPRVPLRFTLGYSSTLPMRETTPTVLSPWVGLAGGRLLQNRIGSMVFRLSSSFPRFHRFRRNARCWNIIRTFRAPPPSASMQAKKPSREAGFLCLHRLFRPYWVIDCVAWLPWGMMTTAVGSEPVEYGVDWVAVSAPDAASSLKPETELPR